MRLHYVKKAGNHLCYTVEVTGSARSLTVGVKAAKVKYSLVGSRIDVNYSWCKGNVHATCLKKCTVSLQCSWVCCKILRIVELCRVYKYAYYSVFASLYRLLYQGDVSLVQSTHSWHKTNAFLVLKALPGLYEFV